MNQSLQEMCDEAREAGAALLKLNREYLHSLKAYYQKYLGLKILQAFKYLDAIKGADEADVEESKALLKVLFEESSAKQFEIEQVEKSVTRLEKLFKPIDVLQRSLDAVDNLLANTSDEELEKIYHEVTDGKEFEGPTIDEYFGGLGMSDEQRELLMNDATILGGHRYSDRPRMVFKINVGERTPEEIEELTKEIKVSLNSKK